MIRRIGEGEMDETSVLVILQQLDTCVACGKVNLPPHGEQRGPHRDREAL